MAPGLPKKRKVLDGLKGQPKKKFRKQRQYHSSSDEASEDDDNEPSDFQAVSLADSDAEDEPAPSKSAKPSKPTKKSPKQKTQDSDKNSTPSEDDDEPDLDNVADDNDDNDDDLSDDDDDASLNSEEEEDDDGEAGAEAGGRAVPKRHDPSAFSNSIAKILMTKLPTSARADPVLSRSKDVAQSRTDFKDEKLDQQARAKLRAEKKEELDRGRVRDVMGVQGGAAGLVAEEEKRLRKVAQRGVVKLFNAVRAAQVRGEEAAKSERKKGTVGMGEREKAVNEVSKQGFLDLISGKKGKPLNIEEA